MDNSLIRSSDISPFITGKEREYLTARASDKLSAMSDDVAVKGILPALNLAYAELGKVPGGSTLQEQKNQMIMLAKLVISDARLYFPHVTLPEIGNAIRRGIRNEYGEYYGFNAISVHTFILGYLNSEERHEVLAKQNRYMESLKKPEPLTPEQIEKIMIDGFELIRQEYYRSKRLRDYNNTNYKWAIEKGLFTVTPEQEQLYLEQADIEVTKELTFEKSLVRHSWERKAIDDAKANRVIFRSREIALKRYFDSSQHSAVSSQ